MCASFADFCNHTCLDKPMILSYELLKLFFICLERRHSSDYRRVSPQRRATSTQHGMSIFLDGVTAERNVRTSGDSPRKRWIHITFFGRVCCHTRQLRHFVSIVCLENFFIQITQIIEPLTFCHKCNQLKKNSICKRHFVMFFLVFRPLFIFAHYGTKNLLLF